MGGRFAVACSLVCALGLACGGADAQSVSLAGSFGGKALLLIDGKARSVAVGSTVEGVRLVSVGSGEAVVEVGGRRVALRLGSAQVNLGGSGGGAGGGGSRIELSAESGGHFVTSGWVNGKSVRFIVDTGATTVSMGQAEAERIGVDYKGGQRMLMRTANGDVPAYRVSLASVRVGDVQVYDVEGTVIMTALPIVLLGNSFLSRFQMKRESDHLTLEKRY